MSKNRRYIEFQEENRISVPKFEEQAGFFTSKTRSAIMANIRGKNTKPEMRFKKALWNAGVRYKKTTKLYGNPDIQILKYRMVIFIDGDFWHGYNWDQNKIKTNQEFWRLKIERNLQRDKHVNRVLISLGFKVFRFWEHEINKNLGFCISQILMEIRQYNHVCYRFDQ